jgi:hypothetical protein
MYGYDYTPATESISGWFKNLVSTVGRKVKEVAEFLKKQIIELGKKIKLGKDYFPTIENNASHLLSSIFNNTYSIIFACSDAVEIMFAEYISVGKVTTTKDPYTSVDDTFYILEDRKFEKKHYSKSGLTIQSVAIGQGNMQKGDNVSDADWNKFQDKISELFELMHERADKIKQDLTELKDMPPLSYQTTVNCYKQLKSLYDANASYGRYWDKLRRANEFADPNSKIKKALGKIVAMYNTGVNAAKAFAIRLNTGNFKNGNNKKYRKGDDIYNKAKNDVKDIGEVSDKRAYKETDRAVYGTDRSIDEYRDKLKAKFKPEETKESVMLSRLYDMAYEDARHDLEMQAEYIRAFESVPNAFDEFETEI